VFNLGTGTNHSINELANMFGGKKKYLPARAGEARETLADISVTTQKTGWQPKFKLEDYIKELK
jgi:nucleoside-diphosphate-sugar epimerase